MEQTSAEKVLVVFKALGRKSRPVGPSELAQIVGLNKSTVNRILISMKKHGFVDQDPATRLYHLGPEAAVIGQAVTKSLEGQIVTIAQPFVDRLRDEIGETVHFEVLSGNHIYLAYRALGPEAITVALTVGDHVTPNVHSGAKAIAAFSNPERVARWLARELPRFTEHSITDPAELTAQFEEIRRNGYAVSRGEYDKNVVGVGAPVFNHRNVPVGAVAIISPIFRDIEKKKQHAVTLLKDTAAAISKRLLSTREMKNE